ncbi:tetratricopeptide repeat protein [Desulfothermus sp.]
MKKTRLSRREFLFGFRQRFSVQPPQATSIIHKEAKKADEYLAHENYKDAKEIYLKMIEHRSDNLVARQKLAYCYYKLGDIKNAMKEFLELRKRGIKSNFTSLYLGLCFAHMGDIENAIKSLKNFFDITKPIVQRAINLQIALYDSNMTKKDDLINSIEQAIEEQNKMENSTL